MQCIRFSSNFLYKNCEVWIEERESIKSQLSNPEPLHSTSGYHTKMLCQWIPKMALMRSFFDSAAWWKDISMGSWNNLNYIEALTKDLFLSFMWESMSSTVWGADIVSRVVSVVQRHLYSSIGLALLCECIVHVVEQIPTCRHRFWSMQWGPWMYTKYMVSFCCWKPYISPHDACHDGHNLLQLPTMAAWPVTISHQDV